MDRQTLRETIAIKLGDKTLAYTFWTREEINFYIEETLLTFGATSAYWKDRDVIQTELNKNFYDLTELVDFLKLEFKNQWLLYAINYYLMEELSITNPTSDLYSVDEILSLIGKLVDQYLLETKLLLKLNPLQVVMSGVEFVNIPKEVLEIKRLAYKSIDGNYTLVQEEDEDNLTSFYENFNQREGTPKYFTQVLFPDFKIALYPKPRDNGSLEIVSINSRTSPLTLTSTIGIINNLVPYIKWGLLAELLSKDGLSNDPVRADYCRTRWDEGIQIGKKYPSVINIEVNGVNKFSDDIENLDFYNSGWQNGTGKFNRLAFLGYNLLAINKRPTLEIDIQSITLDFIRNAPIPLEDGDEIKVRDEFIIDIIEYAVHLASFKKGGVKLQETLPNYKKFLNTSAILSGNLSLKAMNLDQMIKKSRPEAKEVQVQNG